MSFYSLLRLTNFKYMLMIRLQRVGRKNDPSFRVVVVDSRRKPQSGNFLEVVGSYDARKGEPQLKAERISYWLSKGAKTSGTVNNLLVRAKIISGPKIHVSPNPPKKEEAKSSEPQGKPKSETAPAPETEDKKEDATAVST